MNVVESPEQLAAAQATIRSLQDELAETNRGLVALTMELEQRVDARTVELKAAHAELKETNSELMQMTLELEDRVARRTAELEAANATLRQEIAERRRAEAALSATEVRYRRLFEAAQDGILILDGDTGQVVDANPFMKDLLGYSQEEFLGKKLWEIGPFKGEAASRITFAELQRADRIHYDGLPLETKDRRRVEVEFISNAYLVDQHRLIQCNIRDITARKRVEEKMRRMATVVRDSNDAITIQDFEGRITAWNRGAELMYGYGEAEALAANIERLTTPGKVAEQKDFIRRLIAGEAITSFETQRVTKDGRVLDIWMTVTKLMDEAGKAVGLASTERDITARKNAEAHLQHTLADLERSNKELEQFAYVASHDLQEPLRMISSYTQLLAKRYESQLDDKAKRYVNYTVDGAIRMQALINDLLAYSRVGTRGRPLETTGSHAVLGEALRNLAATIAENHALITNDDLPTVRADASQLVLVFQNLLANAIKFRRTDLPRVHVSAQDRGHEWVFAVKDDGIGIEPQHAERVFVIFQRLHTREEYPGTGIGLAVCKRIVERHGGKIWFESVPGHGTTFFFTLPK